MFVTNVYSKVQTQNACKLETYKVKVENCVHYVRCAEANFYEFFFKLVKFVNFYEI